MATHQLHPHSFLGDSGTNREPSQNYSSTQSLSDATLLPSWLADLSDLPCDWALLPLNGAKQPVDPSTDRLLKEWTKHSGFSVDEIQEISPQAVGVMLGPVSGGLIAVDFDGPGSEQCFQRIYGRPSTDLLASLSWSSGKPERRQVAFRVDPDWWEYLQGRKSWRNELGSTILELRWEGHQSAIAGAHPETSGYFLAAGMLTTGY